MFKTEEELEKYLKEEFSSIKCLECGKKYKELGNHLVKKHKITVIDYKQKYGIPQKYSLCCQQNESMRSQRNLEKCEDPIYLTKLKSYLIPTRKNKKKRLFKNVLITTNKLLTRNKIKRIYSEDELINIIKDIKKSNLKIKQYCIRNKINYETLIRNIRKL